MQAYQREFIRFAVECGVLRFGRFTLKSGRSSPYFFNAGLFNTGDRLARLGRFYAEAILAAQLPFDILYGPAYKGIPLVASVAIALARGGRDLPYAFNRKETKDHGEGGDIIGGPLQGRVLIVDDVISAGTSIGESVDRIKHAGATPIGAVIALDRQERGHGALSAVQEVEANYKLRVVSIAQLETLIAFLSESGGAMEEHLAAVRAYRGAYGI